MNTNQSSPLKKYMSEYTAFFEGLGVDLHYLYRNLFIQYPESRPHPLSIDQVSALKNKLYDLLGMPHLGLALGKQVRTSAFIPSSIELFQHNQPTFAELLKIIGRNINASFPSVSLEYFETDKVVGLKIKSFNSSESSNRITVENFVVNLYNHVSLFLGDDVEPEFIAFDYPKPVYGNTYHQYFSCDLRFNFGYSAIVLSKEVSNAIILPTEKNYKQIQDLYLSGSNLPFKVSSVSKKFNLLLSESKDKETYPSLETSAQRLGLSPRTFRRYLKILNTSYLDEIRTFRKRYAIDLLMNSRNSITEIAFLLGFCDASAFNNAFKKWTGKTPRQFKISNIRP